ncbi:hypothetical protein JW935_23605 [candidate division KSB1 bacterium]|nr:hypothetical protein [candidate division KSB1 bacterium]
MKKCLLFISIFLILSNSLAAIFTVYEANYPQVMDYNVNVDEAALTILPRGAYVEMNLEVTVSYNFESWFFKNYNELELLWEFTLPDQAVVSDFWIWLDDTLLQASMLDKWTAELLFSEVSSPVRHPALFTQSFPDREGMVHYKLRLYPIMRDIKRTFKIQYIIPARPTNETLRIWLPTSQLTSRLSPGASSLDIYFMDEKKPVLLGADITKQNPLPDQVGWFYRFKLDYDQFVELVYPSPIAGDFYFSTFTDNGETFYQLAVYPPEVMEQHKPRNFLVLVDYNRFNTQDMDGELVLLQLKETLQQALGAEDHVNFIVGYEDIVFASNELVPCTGNNLDQLFEKILRRSFPAYSNFQMLMAAAADFLVTQAKPVEIILVTNTDEIQLSGLSRSQYAEEIKGMFPVGTRFHIVDLDNKSNLVYNSETGQYETYLTSFFGQLSNTTSGNLFFLRYHTFKNILAALFYEHISHFQEVEVQTRFASGYSYGNHLIALHQGYYPLNFPIMQVGRYNGALPLDVTVLGKVRLDKIQEDFIINETDALPGNETLATAWYGHHVQKLYKKTQTNGTVMDIMDLSLDHRILTPYTGFLVFRPQETQGYEPDPLSGNNNGNQGGGGDENRGGADDAWDVPTTVEDQTAGQNENYTLAVKSWPNPFNMTVQLTITLPDDMKDKALDFAIYNTLGQRIKTFVINRSNANVITLRWDGRDDDGMPVSTGLYFAVLAGPDFRKSVKLMLIK